jgi:thymidylate synthase ThyX
MQFLTLRNDKHALYEIRAVAKDIEEHFASAMPLTYAAYLKEKNEAA